MTQVELELSQSEPDRTDGLAATPESSQAVRDQAGYSVPTRVYPYRVGLTGGTLGGLAMVAVAIAYGILSGRGVWLPVNLIGATLIRDLQTASPETLSAFNLAALVAGLLLHAVMSVGLGLLFAVLLPTLPGPAIIWSLTVGPMLWIVASVLALPLINPLMAKHVDGGSFLVAHVAYGIDRKSVV